MFCTIDIVHYAYSATKLLLFFELTKFFYQTKWIDTLKLQKTTKRAPRWGDPKKLSKKLLGFITRCSLLFAFCGVQLGVRLVVLFTADIPVPCFHGLDAVFALCQERILVSAHFGQVHCAAFSKRWQLPRRKLLPAWRSSRLEFERSSSRVIERTKGGLRKIKTISI